MKLLRRPLNGTIESPHSSENTHNCVSRRFTVIGVSLFVVSSASVGMWLPAVLIGNVACLFIRMHLHHWQHAEPLSTLCGSAAVRCLISFAFRFVGVSCATWLSVIPGIALCLVHVIIYYLQHDDDNSLLLLLATLASFLLNKMALEVHSYIPICYIPSEMIAHMSL